MDHQRARKLLAAAAVEGITSNERRWLDAHVAACGECSKEAAALGKTVLVPVWGESTRPLLGLAGGLAAADGGIVVAASISTEEAPEEELAAHRSLKTKAEEWLAREGLESRTVFRVSRSVPAGLMQTIVGESATMLVVERRAQGGEDLEPEPEAMQLIAQSPVPVLVASGPLAPFRRLLLVVRIQELAPPGRRDLELAAELASRLSHGCRLGLVTPALDPVRGLFSSKRELDRIQTPDPLSWIAANLRGSDLVVLAGLEAAREALRRIPALQHERFLVAIAPQEATLHPREERATGPVVVGRSLTPSPA